jgi:hypothetical protein
VQGLIKQTEFLEAEKIRKAIEVTTLTKQVNEQSQDILALRNDILVLNERIEAIKNRHQADLERREEQSKEQALLRMEMQDEIKSLREKLRTLRET